MRRSTATSTVPHELGRGTERARESSFCRERCHDSYPPTPPLSNDPGYPAGWNGWLPSTRPWAGHQVVVVRRAPPLAFVGPVAAANGDREPCRDLVAESPPFAGGA